MHVIFNINFLIILNYYIYIYIYIKEGGKEKKKKGWWYQIGRRLEINCLAVKRFCLKIMTTNHTLTRVIFVNI
jgi:hypothetical protein